MYSSRRSGTVKKMARFEFPAERNLQIIATFVRVRFVHLFYDGGKFIEANCAGKLEKMLQ